MSNTWTLSDKLPEEGELVVATVREITPYGAYVFLDEYDLIGFLHTSEISAGWVKNIRDFIREGQRLVVKVIRVNEKARQVDVSLRRVTGSERREKLLSVKRRKKAESIIKSALEKIGAADKFEEIIASIEEYYDEVYACLEESVLKGKDVLVETGIPEHIAEEIHKISLLKIKPPLVKIADVLELKCLTNDGIERIKSVLKSVLRGRKPKHAEIRIYVQAIPRYVVEVTARNYKEAEKILKRLTDSILQKIEEVGGEGKLVQSVRG